MNMERPRNRNIIQQLQRIPTLVLILTLLVPQFSAPVHAETLGGIITSITQPEDITQTTGTPQNQLGLPERVTGITASGQTTDIPVSNWQSITSYTPDTAGSYIFRAALGTPPSGYTLAENLEAPTIKVYLNAPSGKNVPSAGPTEDPSADPAATPITITAFNQLDPSISQQAFSIGALTDDTSITQPGELAAATTSGPVTVSGITWSSTDFDPKAPASYTFTAALPEGYELAAGISMPTMTIVIEDDQTTDTLSADEDIWFEYNKGGAENLQIFINTKLMTMGQPQNYNVVKKLRYNGAWTAVDSKFVRTKLTALEEVDLTGSTAFVDYNFDSVKTLKKVQIPTDVDLAVYMFDSCTSLTTLSTGDSSSEDGVIDLSGFEGNLGKRLFGNSGIKKVRIPTDVDLTGYMFYDCTSLTTLTTGNGDFVEDLIDLSGFEGHFANNLFRGSGIQKVRIPEDAYLAEYMFNGCASLTTLTTANNSFEDGVIDLSGFTGTLGSYIFTSSIIQKVRIPADMNLTYAAFSGCEYLTTLTAGEGELIPDRFDLGTYTGYLLGSIIFENTAPQVIRIKGGITVPSMLFQGVTTLKTVIVVGTEKPHLSSNSFDGCPDTGTIFYPRDADASWYTKGTDTDVFKETAIASWDRKTINFEGDCFIYDKDIDGGTLQESIESTLQFLGQTPDSYDYSVVKKLCYSGAWTAADSTFVKTKLTALENVDLSGSTAFVDENFKGVGSLQKVSLPADVDLSVAMFEACSSLTELTTGDKPFETGVIDLSDFTGSFGSNLFSSSSIRKVRIPTTTDLTGSMFEMCASLKELTTGNSPFETGVIDLSGFEGTLGKSLFWKSGIQKVRIPTNAELSETMFTWCTSLKELTVGDNPFEAGVIDFTGFTGTYGRLLFQRSGIQKVRIPTNIDISYGMFASCKSLTTLTAGDGELIPNMFDLGAYSGSLVVSSGFYETKPQRIRLKAGAVGDYTFSQITSLNTVIMTGTAEPSFYGTSFNNCLATGTIYYPDNANSDNWYTKGHENDKFKDTAIANWNRQTIDAAVSPSEADFDKKEGTDLPFTLSSGMHTFDKLTLANANGGAPVELLEGSEYAVTDNVFTLSARALAQRAVDDYILTFEMDGGISPTATISIEDSRTRPIMDNFSVLQGDVNRPFNFDFTLQEGAADTPIKWTLLTAPGYDELPEGLTLDENTGTLSGTPAPDSDGSYRLLLQAENNLNSPAGALSTEGTIMLEIAPAFHAQTPDIERLPENQTTYVGDNGTDDQLILTVEAAVSDGGTLSYQWYRSLTPDGSNAQLIADATGKDFAVPTDAKGIYYYYCKVTNTNNDATGDKTASELSNTVTVNVNPQKAEEPNITTQPVGGIAQADGSLELTVEVSEPTDDGTLSYQWYEHEASGSWITLDGANGASYTITTEDIAAGDYSYYCEVTNTNPTAKEQTATVKSSSADVRYQLGQADGPTNDIFDKKDGSDMTFTLQPGSYDFAGLSVSPSGDDQVDGIDQAGSPSQTKTNSQEDGAGHANINRQNNGSSQDLTEGDDYTVDGNAYTIKAETLARLTDGLQTLTFAMTGGEDLTTAFTVTDSRQAPVIQDESLPAGLVGDSYSHPFDAAGDPADQWQLAADTTLPRGLALSEDGVLSGIPEESGSFDIGITVRNNQDSPAGALCDTQFFTLEIKALTHAEAPVISGITGDSSVRIGADLTLTVRAAAIDGGTLSYQWYSSSERDGTGAAAVAGATAASFQVPTDKKLYTYYFCEVTNTLDAATGETTALAKSSATYVEVGHDTLATLVHDKALAADLELADASSTDNALVAVDVNDAYLSAADFTVVSSQLTLRHGYLDALDLGVHSLTLHYADGGRALMNLKVIDSRTDYSWRTLTDELSGVSVSGMFLPDAVLKVTTGADSLHPVGTCPVCDEIRRRPGRVALYDITVSLRDQPLPVSSDSAEPYQGKLNVTLPIGQRYNGLNMTVLHCADGTAESQQILAENGAVTGTFSGLSPFAVFVPATSGNGGADDISKLPGTASTASAGKLPATGSFDNSLWQAAGVLLLAAIGVGVVWYRRKHRS